MINTENGRCVGHQYRVCLRFKTSDLESFFFLLDGLMESEISEDRDVISQSYPAGFMIVGLGETLFDQFSNRSILGGAPVNAAIHAHQLASVWGGQGVVATRIGVDSLSQRVITELARRGMSTHAVQRDVEHATGTVDVQLQGYQLLDNR